MERGRDSTQRSTFLSLAIDFKARLIEFAEEQRIENLASEKERDSTPRSTRECKCEIRFSALAIEFEGRLREHIAQRMRDLHRRESTQRSKFNSFAIEFKARVIEIAKQRRIENLAPQRERNVRSIAIEIEAELREYVTQRMRHPRHRRDSTPRSRFHSLASECEALASECEARVIEFGEERRIERLAIQRERDFLSHATEIEAQLREYTHRIQRKMIYESLSERSRKILDQTAVAVDVSFFLGQEGDLCSICHDPFCHDPFKDGGAAIAQWPAECAHIFHLDCLLPWLSEHRSCPLCRATF